MAFLMALNKLIFDLFIYLFFLLNQAYTTRIIYNYKQMLIDLKAATEHAQTSDLNEIIF